MATKKLMENISSMVEIMERHDVGNELEDFEQIAVFASTDNCDPDLSNFCEVSLVKMQPCKEPVLKNSGETPIVKKANLKRSKIHAGV